MMYETVQSDSQSNLASLEDYLDAIREKKWLVLGSILFGLLVAWAITALRTPSYAAEATVVVNPTPVGSINANLVAPNLDREVQVIVSDGVAQGAVEILGTNEDPLPLRLDLEAAFVPDSDVISIEFVTGSPERATDVVNAFSDSYVAQRVGEQVDFFDDQISALTEQLELLEADEEDLAEQLGQLNAQRQAVLDDPDITGSAQTAELETISAGRQILQTELNTLAGRLRTIRSDLSDVETDRKTQEPAAAVLSLALEPEVPLGLGRSTILLAGLIFGTILGVIAAFLASRLDRSASSVEDVNTALGTKVIGAVPDLGWRYRRGRAAIVMLSSQRSVKTYQARESYRRLRTAVEFIMRTEDVSKILVTSSHPSEGKSVTSANLAVAIASGGTSVALVNADMRRPSLEFFFGVENSPPGLSNYLGGVSDDYTVERVEELPMLALLTAGPTPANPGELLGSTRFKDLLEELAEQADLVIVDTPPVGATADSAAAVDAVDGVLMVVDAKSTSTEELRLSRADLERAGANVIGAVMNREQSRSGRLRGRKNRYAYSSASSESPESSE